MGSVQSYDLECPVCKQETGFCDFYYKSGEEYFSCQNQDCGYGHKCEWKRNEDGKLVTKDGTSKYKFDNLIMVEVIYYNDQEFTMI